MSEKRNVIQSDEESNSSEEQKSFRAQMIDLFRNSPLPDEELIASLGMYMRSSVLVKILVLEDLYRRVLNVPGCLLEFGCRWGHNLVVLENLRAIFEPFNKTRKIVGFDTFQGYQGKTNIDRGESEVFESKKYQTTEDYPSYLRSLLETHEGSSVLGHERGKHQLVVGDVAVTALEYFDKHPETTVALAYFDMGLYGPTRAALEVIKPYLVPGSVILLDEFTWDEAPGEAIAFREVFSHGEYKIEKHPLTPMRAIVTIR